MRERSWSRGGEMFKHIPHLREVLRAIRARRDLPSIQPHVRDRSFPSSLYVIAVAFLPFLRRSRDVIRSGKGFAKDESRSLESKSEVTVIFREGVSGARVRDSRVDDSSAE